MATTAIGPTSLNILVPAVPELSHQFGATATTMQLTVSLFLIGLAVAQLVMGPLSDRFGRRPVMLAGLGLTVFASLMAIVMPTVESVIAARILQAIGASAGIVVARAIIRDLFGRERAASVLGLVATVMVAAPTLGPLIGGLLETFFRWQAIFIFTALTSLAVVLWAAITLPETRGLSAPAGQSAGFSRDLKDLMRSRSFIGYVLIAAFGSSTFFVFLGGGPHVIVTLMGRTSAEYGLWFALSSIGYMAGNFTASRLSMRYGIHALIRWGIVFEIIGATLATVLAWFAHDFGPPIVFLPQLVIALRQRHAAARRDRGRDQRAAASRGNGRRHHRLHADGPRRPARAIRRVAPGRRDLRGADGVADGVDGHGARVVVPADRALALITRAPPAGCLETFGARLFPFPFPL